jgi:REP element-mobilizing transposase RayT
MNFEENYIYHVYNRSNEAMYKSREDYIEFVKRMHRYLKPVSDIIAWCLMPNHFHILLVANSEGETPLKYSDRMEIQKLSNNIGVLLSSYTKRFNLRYDRRGSLVAHNTKAKCLNEYGDADFLMNCFHYIHQNPLRAGLCKHMSEWEFSSFRDYAGTRSGSLVNKKLAYDMINLDKDNFAEQSEYLVKESSVVNMT